MVHENNPDDACMDEKEWAEERAVYKQTIRTSHQRSACGWLYILLCQVGRSYFDTRYTPSITYFFV